MSFGEKEKEKFCILVYKSWLNKGVFIKLNI